MSSSTDIFEQRAKIRKARKKDIFEERAALRHEKEDDSLLNVLESGVREVHEQTKDIAKGVALGTIKRGLGDVGNILDVLGLQTKEMPPGYKQLLEAEYAAPEHLQPFLQDDDILGRFYRLPSSEEITDVLESMGVERERPTVLGRVAEKAGEGIGGALAFLNPALAIPFAAGGIAGQTLRELGAPPWMAAIADMAVSLKGGLREKGVRKLAPSKPSGLKTRTFEKITKPKTVFPKTLENINTAVEEDFRKISSSLLGKNKTVKNLKNVPEFEQQVGKTFKKVEELAEDLPKNILSATIKRGLRKHIEKKTARGFSDSEMEKTYRQFMKTHHKSIQTRTFISPKQLVEQYRKNNKELGKLYEPGKSRSFNEAKAQALIDYNKEIASLIEKKYPNEPFSKLFKESNKNWSEIKSFEKVNSTLDKFFDGKLNFKEVRKSLESERFQKALETLIGKEGKETFNTLNKDLLTTEKAHSLLKKAKEKGVAESLLKHGKLFLISPWLAKGKLALQLGKTGMKKIFQKGLSSPAYMTDWKKGIQLMKKGEYRDAGIIFNRLYKEAEKEES